MTFQLLKCLAKAIAKHGGKLVCSVIPGAQALYEVAADALLDYRQRQQEDALRAELQALAQAPADQVRQEVQAAVQAEAADLNLDVQQKLAAYLMQVPALIRRSLRRPSDPTGTTVPASLALRRPDDLLPFLPARSPRFHCGDRPLPGVDWILEEPLGVGGFGEVWKARHAHMRSKPPVALKFCLDPAAAPVLRNEAGILDRVMQHGRHPGIVPLLQTYLSADPPCLEYEYVEGGDLASLIQELHSGGIAGVDLANRLLLRLAEIVAFAHQASPPIVHGDLKPANVLARRGPQGEISLRVTDFGIGGLAAERAAREARQPTRSRQELLTEAVRGAYTPLYASPQQMLRRPGEPADPRDDVHALGVIWYQLVTGDLGMMNVPPDWREQVEERGLGQEVARLLASCIAPKTEKRPANASVLFGQLQTTLATVKKPQPDDGPESRTPQLQPANQAVVDQAATDTHSAISDPGVPPVLQFVVEQSKEESSRAAFLKVSPGAVPNTGARRLVEHGHKAPRQARRPFGVGDWGIVLLIVVLGMLTVGLLNAGGVSVHNALSLFLIIVLLALAPVVWWRLMRSRSDPQEALLEAAEHGSLKRLKKLIRAGVDLECRDEMGETPLMKAARKGYIGTVKLLIANGAKVDAMNPCGETALSLAMREGRAYITELLRQARVRE